MQINVDSVDVEGKNYLEHGFLNAYRLPWYS